MIETKVWIEETVIPAYEIGAAGVDRDTKVAGTGQGRQRSKRN